MLAVVQTWLKLLWKYTALEVGEVVRIDVRNSTNP